MTRKVTDPSRDPLPEWLQELVPEDLKDAEVIGLETAGIDDSVLLYGPPGAGKTTTMGFRVALLSREEGLTPRDITVVTYRTSQADVMQERLNDEWDVFGADMEDLDDPFRFWSTAHAIACRSTDFHDRFEAARESEEFEHGDVAGMVTNTDPNPEFRFCRDVGIQYKSSDSWRDSKWDVFHSLYTYAKNNLLDVGSWDLSDSMLRGVDRKTGETDEEYTNRVVAQDPRAWRKLQAFKKKWGSQVSFHAVVETWENWKETRCVCDFYEQLEAGILGSLPPQRLVVIDELHDATPLMAAYFERLVDVAETAIVAGDPDQTINAFSGSDPRIFTGIPDRVDTDLPMVQLPESHRCPDEAFLAASRMLAQAHSPPALATNGAGKLYRHEPAHTFSFNDNEGWDLPNPNNPRSPIALWDEFGSDIMFLARTQMMLDAPAAQLDEHGVIYQSQDDVAGNWTARCKLLELIELFTQFHPDVGRDPSNADSTTIDYADARIFVQHVGGKFLSGQSSRMHELDYVREEIRSLEIQEKPLTIARFDELVEDGFWQTYGAGRQSIDELYRLNPRHGFTGDISRDVTAMKMAWERYQGEAFSDGVKALSNGTKLWTMHAAKGDEAEHVVVYSGITRTTKNSIEEYDDEAANEARTWYVALTRTMNGLHIVRDAFEMTVDEYLPDDLEIMAARAAEDYREKTKTGGAGGAVTGGD